MAVKFSEFTSKTVAADVTEIVGYIGPATNQNIRIPPANLDTLVTSATAQSGANATYTLTGTKTGTASTTDVTTFTASGGITLTAGTNTIDISSSGGTNTTYDFAAAADGANVDLKLTGSDASTDTVKATAGTNITFSSITATGFTISATNSQNTYTLPISGTSSAVTATLTGSAGDTDPVLITAGSDISFGSITSAGFTINSTATGGVSSVDETTPGTSTGVPIVVNPTTGTVLVQSMAYAGQSNVGHVPAGGSAGQYLDGDTGAWTTLPSTLSISKQQFTGNNSTTDFTLTTPSGCTVDNLAIYISGVYQNKLDASSGANFTVGAGTNPTLAFSPAPPVTATNGIEVVITR